MSTLHHVAITVSDFDRSIKFYEKLGFKILFAKDTPEKSKRLALLGMEDLKIEVFWFGDLVDIPDRRSSMGNNVNEVGQKHFAINIESVDETRRQLEENGIPLASEPDVGDAGYGFFFIRDPDGIWIEYVQDNA